MLLELFFLEREIEFEPTGSMTQEVKGKASAQADESYQLSLPLRVMAQSIDVEQGRGFIRRYIVLGGDGERSDADIS